MTFGFVFRCIIPFILYFVSWVALRFKKRSLTQKPNIVFIVIHCISVLFIFACSVSLFDIITENSFVMNETYIIEILLNIIFYISIIIRVIIFVKIYTEVKTIVEESVDDRYDFNKVLAEINNLFGCGLYYLNCGDRLKLTQFDINYFNVRKVDICDIKQCTYLLMQLYVSHNDMDHQEIEIFLNCESKLNKYAKSAVFPYMLSDFHNHLNKFHPNLFCWSRCASRLLIELMRNYESYKSLHSAINDNFEDHLVEIIRNATKNISFDYDFDKEAQNKYTDLLIKYIRK